MKTYGPGTKVFLDWIASKPEGRCLRVIEPGAGNSLDGKIEVEITDPSWLTKNDVVVVKAKDAVPKAQEFRKPGSFYRWVNTDYRWEVAP